MDLNWIIEWLDSEWDTDGFFDRVRNGDYDVERGKEVLNMLHNINLGEHDPLPRRLVTLLWYLPSFLYWQTERVAERGGDKVAYEKFTTDVHNTLEDVLGTP